MRGSGRVLGGGCDGCSGACMTVGVAARAGDES